MASILSFPCFLETVYIQKICIASAIPIAVINTGILTVKLLSLYPKITWTDKTIKKVKITIAIEVIIVENFLKITSNKIIVIIKTKGVNKAPSACAISIKEEFTIGPPFK